MSVYNGERYLQQTIDGIIGQHYSDFEFIIIDDGSTDCTTTILDSYSDPRIRVLRNPQNIGLAKSLNRGLAAARGEFIARQDADDVSEPDRLSRQVAFLDAHPDIALVGSAHLEIDAAGRILSHIDANCNHVTILWAMLFYCPFAHSAVMFRRTPVLETVGAYDPSFRYSMDVDYWIRISAHFRVANLAEPLVRLRRHDASMTSTYGSYTSEGYQLQVQAVAALLPHLAAAREDLEATYSVLCALMFGPPSEHPAAQLLDAVDLMFELQHAFARDRQLSRAERELHLVELRSHLFNALLAFSRAEPAGNMARRFLWRAVRIDPRRLRQPRVAASLATLLASHALSAGARLLTRAIRRSKSARRREDPDG